MDQAPLPPPLPPPLPSPVRVRLTQFEPHPCVYLPGREARSRGLLVREIPPDVYEAFLDRGFRRSGQVLYQPNCLACRACIPIRIDVATFAPSPSQRRVERRNADLQVRVDSPRCTPEKFNLYCRYLLGQHGRLDEPATPESLSEFLYSSPTETVEVEYRDASGKLVGIGICDLTPNVLSSVYYFWDPAEHRRSLGIYSAIQEVIIAKLQGKRWYHLGYWIENSTSMHYKGTLGDHAVLTSDGRWADRTRIKP